MSYEEHINHFKNWYVNHKSYSDWQKQLNVYKLDNEDIVLIYAKETMVIKTDEETINYWTSEFVCEDILEQARLYLIVFNNG